jgi:hypothetical protein
MLPLTETANIRQGLQIVPEKSAYRNVALLLPGALRKPRIRQTDEQYN